jgi:hypothetical protein
MILPYEDQKEDACEVGLGGDRGHDRTLDHRFHG